MPLDAAPNHSTPAPAPGLDPGVADHLLADAYYQLVRTLRLTLPRPLTDSADDLVRRDQAALASALIAGGTPALAALDREFPEACPVPRHGARAA